MGGALLVEVMPGVLGYILTQGDPTVETLSRFMREWLVIETVDASRVQATAPADQKATFFVRHGIEARHGRAILHAFFQCS
jgi:hypothetical protein